MLSQLRPCGHGQNVVGSLHPTHNHSELRPVWDDWSTPEEIWDSTLEVGCPSQILFVEECSPNVLQGYRRCTVYPGWNLRRAFYMFSLMQLFANKRFEQTPRAVG